MADNLAIYIHWPFCASKCPYCDFNSHVSETIDHDLWIDCYAHELTHIATQTKKRIVTSIFFGGGTPSLMQPRTIQSIIDNISKQWDVSSNVEITLEANPTSIEAQKFKDFRDAGVNRVSVGIQSLRDTDLKFLGRQHTAEEALNALKIASNTFDRYSFDLIYARPEQTTQDWKSELKEAIQYANGHLSLYQLTIEQGTPFYIQHQRGAFRIPEQDQAGEFYEVTQYICEANNLPAYEISNHASKGQESIHNMAYWQYQDYAGIGPGAHGRLTFGQEKFATRTHRAPDIWCERVQATGHGYHAYQSISTPDQKIEQIMMGLRLRQGIPLEIFDEEMMTKIDVMETENFLKRTNTHIHPTLEGMQRLNSVLSYLLT